MKDVFYGFKLAVGFVLAQFILGAIGLGIGLVVLYGLGLTLTQAMTGN